LGNPPIDQVPIRDLHPNPKNARKHPPGQIDLLAASICEFGFLIPLVIDETGLVLAGHGRLEAAKKLDFKALPCVRVDHLSEAQKKAFALADNRIAELSEWDEDLLGEALEELSFEELDFEITGFDTVDMDRLLAPPNDNGADPETGLSVDADDDLPDLARTAVTRPGDLWILGDHRLICGDALVTQTYRRLLAGTPVRQVFTDPPYNVAIQGHVSGKKGFREFSMASGEMSEEEFLDFLERVLEEAVRCVIDGAILHVCMDWRHLDALLFAGRTTGLELKNLCVWVKPNAGMGSFYRSQHELVAVFKHGKAKHLNTFGLGARGRFRSNVWTYPSVMGPRDGINGPEDGHPTVKPTSLVMDALRDCSKRGDAILDPFGGSGTTLIAAERVGRRAHLIEIDPLYVDLTIRRWQCLTGEDAVLADDGRSFDEVADDRNDREG
jgi:DNA modification methylase